MKIKSFVIFAVVFMLVYVVIISLSAPFLVSWGAKPSLFQHIINFLMSFPINWDNLIVNKSFFFIFLNGLFWGIIVYLFKVLIVKLSRILKI